MFVITHDSIGVISENSNVYVNFELFIASKYFHLLCLQKLTLFLSYCYLDSSSSNHKTALQNSRHSHICSIQCTGRHCYKSSHKVAGIQIHSLNGRDIAFLCYYNIFILIIFAKDSDHFYHLKFQLASSRVKLFSSCLENMKPR